MKIIKKTVSVMDIFITFQQKWIDDNGNKMSTTENNGSVFYE